MFSIPASANSGKSEAGVDTREALFNRGECGPIKQIQVATDRVVAVRGILFDLDPDMYQPGTIIPEVPSDPVKFYNEVIRPMLDRHPVLAKAEVRNSGRGLHAILRFDEPVQFQTAGDRERWAGIIEVVQASLPIDPDQPGITATTRAVGSINGKNGVQVTVLAKGDPVTEEEVLGLYNEMATAPFRTVMKILTGGHRKQPCPICGKAGTELSALPYVGSCYGSCGNVCLSRLYDAVLVQRNVNKQEDRNASDVE